MKEKVIKFFKDMKRFFYVILLVFIISSFLGYFFGFLFEDIILNFMKELIEKTAGMNFIELFFFILQNNITTAFIALVSGVFLGVFPLFFTFANGYILGFVADQAVQAEGYGVLLKLLPHGIFELPALFISLALGLRLGLFFLAKDRKKELKIRLLSSLKIFLYVIIPLLVIAAVIETGLIFFWN